MLDMETGRFIMGEGLELYPGMTREEFLKSKIFQEELLYSEDKKDLNSRSYDLRDQNIDGFWMSVAVRFSLHDYVTDIILSKPEYYKWPDWPEDRTEREYAHEIMHYNDAFVRKQVEMSIAKNIVKENDYNCYSGAWGYIGSGCDLRDIPRVEVKIEYNEIPFLRAAGYDFGDMSIEEIFG